MESHIDKENNLHKHQFNHDLESVRQQHFMVLTTKPTTQSVWLNVSHQGTKVKFVDSDKFGLYLEHYHD